MADCAVGRAVHSSPQKFEVDARTSQATALKCREAGTVRVHLPQPFLLRHQCLRWYDRADHGPQISAEEAGLMWKWNNVINLEAGHC